MPIQELYTITKHNEKNSANAYCHAKEAKEMLKVTHIAMGQNNLCHQNRVSISICFGEKVFEKYFSELDASTQLCLNKLRFISLIRTEALILKDARMVYCQPTNQYLQSEQATFKSKTIQVFQLTI